jgi:hypothetical protein
MTKMPAMAAKPRRRLARGFDVVLLDFITATPSSRRAPGASRVRHHALRLHVARLRTVFSTRERVDDPSTAIVMTATDHGIQYVGMAGSICSAQALMPPFRFQIRE